MTIRDIIWGGKPSDRYRFFSYEKMRNNQKVGIPIIYDFLSGDKKMFALKAPTGSGKEAMFTTAIVQALVDKKVDRVILVAPTTTGIERDGEELKRIADKWSDKLPAGFLIVVASNKYNLCKYKEMIKPEGVYQLCKTMRKRDMCPHYFEDEDVVLKLKKQKYVNFNDDKTIELCGDSCPYFIQMKLFKEASLIVCDFNYIIKKFIKEKVFDFDFSKTTIVFNEAHLLHKRAMFQNTLSYSTILNAIKETKDGSVLKKLKEIKGCMKKLANRYSKNIKEDRFENIGEGFAKVSFRELNDEININKTIRLLKPAYESILKDKIEAKKNMFSWLGHIIEFLTTLRIYYSRNGNTKKLMWIMENRDKNVIRIGVTNTLAFIPLYETFENTYKVIFYSATIYENWLKTVLGLFKWAKNIEYVDLPNEFPKENRKNIVIPKHRIMRSDLSVRNMRKFSAEILKTMKRCKGRTAIIATNGIWDKIGHEIKKEKDVYEPPKGVKKIKRRKYILYKIQSESYSSFSPYSWTGVSLDIPKVDNAIVVGVATPKYNLIQKTIVKNYAQYLKGPEKKTFFIIMTLFAVLMELQAVGRFQRGEKDKINIFWVDERYGKSLKGFVK